MSVRRRFLALTGLTFLILPVAAAALGLRVQPFQPAMAEDVHALSLDAAKQGYLATATEYRLTGDAGDLQEVGPLAAAEVQDLARQFPMLQGLALRERPALEAYDRLLDLIHDLPEISERQRQRHRRTAYRLFQAADDELLAGWQLFRAVRPQPEGDVYYHLLVQSPTGTALFLVLGWMD